MDLTGGCDPDIVVGDLDSEFCVQVYTITIDTTGAAPGDMFHLAFGSNMWLKSFQRIFSNLLSKSDCSCTPLSHDVCPLDIQYTVPDPAQWNPDDLHIILQDLFQMEGLLNAIADVCFDSETMTLKITLKHPFYRLCVTDHSTGGFVVNITEDNPGSVNACIPHGSPGWIDMDGKVYVTSAPDEPFHGWVKRCGHNHVRCRDGDTDRQYYLPGERVPLQLNGLIAIPTPTLTSDLGHYVYIDISGATATVRTLPFGTPLPAGAILAEGWRIQARRPGFLILQK